jgi:hypothetical protein
VSVRDDLEASVFDGDWKLDQLAVYADELQRTGDPRGELIALDLHGTPEVAARKRELLGLLIGDAADSPAVRCRYGFVELEVDDTTSVDIIAKLGPFARYVRAVRIVAPADTIAATFAALALTARPHLASLTIRQRSWGAYAEPNVSAKAMAALAATAPRLAAVDIRGHGVLALLAHPAVRRLRITGIDAVLSFTQPSELLPRVDELDLAWALDDRMPLHDDAGWARYIPPLQFPALRRLDLSRNDPPHMDLDAFRFLRQAPIAPQLTHVRLPPLTVLGQLTNAQAALDRMPDLELVELPASPFAASLLHPRARLHTLRPRPWQPMSRTMVTFVVGPLALQVMLVDAARWLDAYYDEMPADARAAWDYLWDVLLRQPRRPGRAVFAEQLARALDACGGHLWSNLHRALRAADHGPGVMITVSP